MTSKSVLYSSNFTPRFALQKNNDGNINTIGHIQILIAGMRRSIATKWSKNLDHIATPMNLDEDPKTTFNHIYIDGDNRIRLGGN